MEKIVIKTSNGLEFPSIVFGPKKSNTLVLNLGGCGSVKDISQLFGIKDESINYRLLTFDYRGCGESKLSSSRSNRRYVKDVYLIIEACKKQNSEIEKVYIIGESWGGNLAILFQKKYPNVASGFVIWNTPTKVVNNTTRVKIEENDDTFTSITFKTILTLFTNIDTRLKPPGVEQLSQNRIYTRSIRIGRSAGNCISARMILAAWFSMIPSWRFIKKHFKKDSLPPFVIIQSKEDFYYKKNIKTLNKLKSLNTKNNKIIFQENGFHVLSVESKNSAVIWEEVLKLVNN